MSVIAFHEKAGRSQVNSFWFSLDKVFSLAELPLSPPFHPHSRWAIFARCKLGVLVSAGAATWLATSPPSRRWKWARRLTQSPELGVLAFVFPFL